MKVFIMTDLEGISGVSHIEYMDLTKPYYNDARRLLMGDVNAAVAGAFDGGATEVFVRDAHFMGINFIPDLLDPRAITTISRGSWYDGVEGMDASFFVGVHTMAGTRGAFLSHTQSSAKIFAFRVNGTPMGEIGQWALGCGHYGVPLVMVSGDEAACVEARDLLPGIGAVPVKKAICRNRAECYPVSLMQQRIREAARASLVRPFAVKPLVVEKPIVCEQVYMRPDYADDTTRYERVDGCTCRKTVDRQCDIVM